MEQTTTNVFAFLNAHEFRAAYRKYEIRGLKQDEEGFYRKLDSIGRQVGSLLKTPATTLVMEGKPMLVLRQDASVPPESLMVYETPVRFQEIPGLFDLTAQDHSIAAQKIRINLLRAAVQEELQKRKDLWQPHSSGPFYQKHGEAFDDVTLFRGFKWTIVLLPDDTYGICLDPTTKIVRTQHLPMHFTHDQFETVKFNTFLYKYGLTWYEIRPTNLSDFTYEEYPVEHEGKIIHLKEFMRRTLRPIPPELLSLRNGTSMLEYQNGQGKKRGAPTVLCHRVLGSSQASHYNHKARLSPAQRLEACQKFIKTYLPRLQIGDVTLRTSSEPHRATTVNLPVPALEFGHQHILSVHPRPGSEHVHLEELGRRKKQLLYERKAGYFTDHACYHFYFVVPESVMASFGELLLRDLTLEVQKLVPGAKFKPTLLEYSDADSYSKGRLGRRILEVIQQEDVQGNVLIMLPRPDHPTGEEDRLAIMVLSALYQQKIQGSVIHTDTPLRFLDFPHTQAEPSYRVNPKYQGHYQGYLRNVAINKILLLEGHYPFVLADRLHADVTIGLDVKNNTAGILAVNHKASRVYYDIQSSQRKEKLRDSQVYKYLIKILKDVSNDGAPPKNIVILRDGRLFSEEIHGAERALLTLIRDGVLDPEATLTFLEISKSSFAPVRFFLQRSNNAVQNPEIGRTWILPDTREAYVATTGYPFLREKMTARPLHVRYIQGHIPFKQCLEDLFHLSTLTWSQVEGQTRYPLTTQLNDRYLADYTPDRNDDLEFEDLIEEEAEQP